MLRFSRNTSRNLCTLTLACTMLATPAFATQHTQPDASNLTSSIQSSYASYQESVRLYYTEKLTLAGYSSEEIVYLLDTLPSYRLPTLLRYSYSPTIVEYVRQPHFTDTRLDRYLSYGSGYPELAPATVVTRVNIGLDRSFYTSVQLVKEPARLDVLVNKYNYLSSKFTPELVSMEKKYASYNGASMHPEAYQWFTKMVDDAAADGLWLTCVSAYRSHSYQNTLYTRYVSNNGKALADTFSARPGYSEHQTGLAVDINVASSSAHFENTAQYRWLSANAWKYGFILRYPQGKEHITGFRFEPWHYRYVGLDTAKEVYESGLTWEEYLMGPPIAEQSPSSDAPVEVPSPESQPEDSVVTAPVDEQNSADNTEENSSASAPTDEQSPVDKTEENTSGIIPIDEQNPTGEIEEAPSVTVPADTQSPDDISETAQPEDSFVEISIDNQTSSEASDTDIQPETSNIIAPSKPQPSSNNTIEDTQTKSLKSVSGLGPNWSRVSLPDY